MNICVLSYGRTGGTAFCNWLSKELKKTYIHEPFNPNHLERYQNINLSDNDFIIKLEPEQIEGIKGKKIIIGLIRENIEDCAISHLYASETNIWHLPYVVTNDWITSNRSKLDIVSERLLKQNDNIRNMKCDILLTYEGLFLNKLDVPKICKFLNIKNPSYINYINESGKYRKALNYKKPLI
jgi:hypothetical protein